MMGWVAGVVDVGDAPWRRWLGWRYPHYDQMEDEASGTLTGAATAVVRVGFDASAECAADWHVTLFTRTRQTPDPPATFAAALRWKPIGMILHHVVTDGESLHERAPHDPRPGEIVQAVEQARSAVEAAWSAKTDGRVPTMAMDRLERLAAVRMSEGRALVEAAIVDGLLARQGFLLVPPMIVRPHMLDDYRLYLFALAVRAGLDVAPRAEACAWRPSGVAVCAACTTVFVRRRPVATHCRLCSKRPAIAEVIGQRPLSDGQRQTVRVPDRVGNMIVGWKTTTVGLCPICGAPFSGRRDATTCPQCSNRERQRRYRAGGSNDAA